MSDRTSHRRRHARRTKAFRKAGVEIFDAVIADTEARNERMVADLDRLAAEPDVQFATILQFRR